MPWSVATNDSRPVSWHVLYRNFNGREYNIIVLSYYSIIRVCVYFQDPIKMIFFFIMAVIIGRS